MVDQKRGSRGRSLLALVACAVIAAASILWVLPARGDSTWRDGWCRQGEGQTVVIDWSTYPDLVTAIPGTDGGTTLVRCIVFPEGEPRSYTSTTGDGRTQPLDDAGIPWAGSGLITEINGIEAEGLDSYEWWFYTIGYVDGSGNGLWGSGWSATPDDEFVGVALTRDSMSAPPIPLPQYAPPAATGSPEPSAEPTGEPTGEPTDEPSANPSASPDPTQAPTATATTTATATATTTATVTTTATARSRVEAADPTDV